MPIFLYKMYFLMVEYTSDFKQLRSVYVSCGFNTPFESAFFNMKPHAAVRIEKLWRSDHPYTIFRTGIQAWSKGCIKLIVSMLKLVAMRRILQPQLIWQRHNKKSKVSYTYTAGKSNKLRLPLWILQLKQVLSTMPRSPQ